MITPLEYLYLLAEDLYRLGNSHSARLQHVRDRDVDFFDRNGIQMVRSNGKGISLLNQARLEKVRSSAWVWKIPANTQLPTGLALYPDPDPDKKGHYLLCPDYDMTLDKYCALLSELALHCEKVMKI